MNKFHFDKESFLDSAPSIIATTIAIMIASKISQTPNYITMLILTMLTMIFFIYLSFFENDENILFKWHAKIAFHFLIFCIFSMLAYMDFIWFNTGFSF